MAIAANAEAIEATHSRRTRFARADLLNAIAELRICFLMRRENERAER
jgi:hypothetical protein